MAPWAALADRLDPPARPERDDPVALASSLDDLYQRRPHLDVIGREVAALERGDFDRLMINTPPQVGKSVTAIDWTALWWLARHPRARIVIGSYGGDLAFKRGRAVRRLVESHGAALGLRLARGERRMGEWSLTTGGGVKSVGIGSGITGFDADVILVDDPVRSRKDADSLVKRDDTHNWWSADLLSRQQPGLKVILVQTPWHPDDLRARVLRDEGDRVNGGRWRVVVMPALATSPDDPLGRAAGEPLSHPKIVAMGDAGVLLEHWLSIRRSVAARDWESLWQCDPRLVKGALLTWELLRERRWWAHGARGLAPARVAAVSVDPSGGGRDVAGVVGGQLGEDGRVAYTHDRSGVMSSEAWSRAACELAMRIGADRIIFEQNYGGDMARLAIRTAWEALRRERPDEFGAMCPRIVAVVAKRNKTLRAEPVAQQWIEDRIGTGAYLPDLESEWATWQVGADSPGRLDASVHMALELLPMPGMGEATMAAGAALAEVSLAPWR